MGTRSPAPQSRVRTGAGATWRLALATLILAACAHAPAPRASRAAPRVAEPEHDPTALFAYAFPRIAEVQPLGVLRCDQRIVFVLRDGEPLEVVDETGFAFEVYQREEIAPQTVTIGGETGRQTPVIGECEPVATAALAARVDRWTRCDDECRRSAEMPPGFALATLAHFARELGDRDVAQRASTAIDRQTFTEDLARASLIDAFIAFKREPSLDALHERLLVASALSEHGPAGERARELELRLGARYPALPLGPNGERWLEDLSGRSPRAAIAALETAAAVGDDLLARVLEDDRPTYFARRTDDGLPTLWSLGTAASELLARRMLEPQPPSREQIAAWVAAEREGGEYAARQVQLRTLGEPFHRGIVVRMVELDRTRAVRDLGAELARRSGESRDALLLLVIHSDVPELDDSIAAIAARDRLGGAAAHAVALHLAEREHPRALEIAKAILRDDPARGEGYVSLAESLTREGGVGLAAVGEVLSELDEWSVQGAISALPSLDPLRGPDRARWIAALERGLADQTFLPHHPCPTGRDDVAAHLAELLEEEEPDAVCALPPSERARRRAAIEAEVRRRIGAPRRAIVAAVEPTVPRNALIAIDVAGSETLGAARRLQGTLLEASALTTAIEQAAAETPRGSICALLESDGEGLLLHLDFAEISAPSFQGRSFASASASDEFAAEEMVERATPGEAITAMITRAFDRLGPIRLRFHYAWDRGEQRTSAPSGERPGR